MKHAGFWRQFFAVTIDLLSVGLLSKLVSETYFYFMIASANDPAAARANADLIFLLLEGVLLSFYYVYFNGRTGVTLGRRLMNIKLTILNEPNRDGIGYLRAAARLVLFVVVRVVAYAPAAFGAPAIFSVVFTVAVDATFLWLFMDPHRRTLEDVAAGTLLVCDPTGKFPDFDPDKLPVSKSRPYSYAALLIIDTVAAIFVALHK